MPCPTELCLNGQSLKFRLLAVACGVLTGRIVQNGVQDFTGSLWRAVPLGAQRSSKCYRPERGQRVVLDRVDWPAASTFYDDAFHPTVKNRDLGLVDARGEA